jgi:hypothetical protein
MMTAILPDTDTPIKTLDEPTDGGGAIVIRLGLDGIRTVEIIADQSDEDDRLRERLTAARPVLEMLQAVMRADR